MTDINYEAAIRRRMKGMIDSDTKVVRKCYRDLLNREPD
jgi:hypothetical protein